MKLPASYRPSVGDRFAIEGPGIRPFVAIVATVDGGKAKVSMADPREGGGASPHGVWMPTESVRHFVHDLQGVVDGPPVRHRLISAVLSGRATLLGKGDDGVVFRVGDHTVKVSTTVPYQPFNPGHLTPRAAIDRMVAQHRVSEAMRASGVPGIFESTLVVHGDKAFLMRPFVQIPTRLTREMLDQVAQSVEVAHERGWVFRDEIQVGTYKGRVYHFDVGKAARSTTHAKRHEWTSEESSDIQALKRLFKDHGEQYLTAREKEDPIAKWDAIVFSADPKKMSPDERKAMRRQLLQLDTEIKFFVKNHPGDARVGFWDDPEFHRDEVRIGMARYAEPAAGLSSGRAHAFLPLSTVKVYEAEARRRGVSKVARSATGFLAAYKRAGGVPERLSEAWVRKREGFIARHMAEAQKNLESFALGKRLTRRHLALIMWAYSPRAKAAR